jgi:cytochrome o ubiquinol oxidase subunit 3
MSDKPIIPQPATAAPLTAKQTSLSQEVQHKDSMTLFGFWLYLMTDFILFASLFATYAVLRNGVALGPTGLEIFDQPYVLAETFILLTSSFVAGLSLLAAKAGKKNLVLAGLVVTALLGLAFVSMEFTEFGHLVALGHSWQQSGFLSAYFILVGTHGLHITVGLFWVVAIMIAIMRTGLTRSNLRKLLMWSFFWHFLDLVWIFIFTIVYLMAV